MLELKCRLNTCSNWLADVDAPETNLPASPPFKAVFAPLLSGWPVSHIPNFPKNRLSQSSTNMATSTALFVIDIQNDLATDPKTRVPHAERIRIAGDKILATARAILRGKSENPPTIIVFVQHEETPESGSLVRGSEPWKLVFEPQGDGPEILVSKTTRESQRLRDLDIATLATDSAVGDTFASNPDLAASLKESGVREIIVFGIQSECCVESTCSGALEAGFDVTLLARAHSTYDDGDKSAQDIEREVQERLQTKGVKVVKWEEAVAAWEKDGRICCQSL